MTPNKHNDSQSTGYGNRRNDNMLPFMLVPPPFFMRGETRRPLREYTPEELHQRAMDFLAQAIAIANEGVLPRRRRNSDNDDDSDPRTPTRQ